MKIADEARVFSFHFLELRREFALRKHLEIYGRRTCPSCKGKVSRKVHGERGRRSFLCPGLPAQGSTAKQSITLVASVTLAQVTA